MKNKKIKNNIINFPNDITENEREIEAVLFAAEEPLDVKTIETNIEKKTNVFSSLSGLLIRSKRLRTCPSLIIYTAQGRSKEI